MKNFKTHLFLISLLVLLFKFSISSGQDIKTDSIDRKDPVEGFRDGIYIGASQSKYVDEPYWGLAVLKVENGILAAVSFSIRDSSLHETFDGKYEKHFAGNPIYVLQSRNDWAGVQAYPGMLTGKKDTASLDAISGATWSYNIFRASVRDALKNGQDLSDTLLHHPGL